MSKPSTDSKHAATTEPEHTAILMMDVQGYTKLPDWATRKFFDIVLPKINSFLNSARYKNSWGDGIIAVFDKARPHVRAAETALDIIAWFDGTDWGQELNLQLQDPLRVRIALNCGALCFANDPIKGGEGCVGRPIHVCARMEPIVEPGQAWCPDNFASQLREECNNDHPRVGAQMLGQKLLSKGYGLSEVYVLVDKKRERIYEKAVILGHHANYCTPVRDIAALVPEMRLGEMTAEQLHEIVHRAIRAPIGDLQRQLTPYLGSGRGVFGERSDHYKDEKRAIARFWMSHLRQQLAQPSEQPEKKYRLFLDSGTTIYSAFEEFTLENNWSFLRKLSIELITNNVPGFMLTLDDEVIRHDRSGSGDGLARRIKILPGAPVARYRAIVSEETIAYLSEKYRRSSGFHNIVVTTGNFARHDAKAIYARDDFHFRFKKALVELADEVWTLLPLGKIMPVGWDGDMLNKHIELMGRSDERYNTVEIPENTVHRIVTTTRRNAVKK